MTQPILYAFAKAIYNIYFHRLSKFPGPKFAAATEIPIAWVSWNGSLSQWLAALHEQYSSDVVRTSPNELSFISPSAWNDLYGHRQGHAKFPKDLRLWAGVQGILTAPDADHSRMRRLLSHAFSDKALREQQSLIQSHVDNLINGLKGKIQAQSNGKVDLTHWYNWTTFDVIGDLSFGESFNCLRDTMYHPWVAMLRSSITLVTKLSTTLRFPPLQKLLGLLVSKKMKQEYADHRKLSAEKVDRRMASETTRPDFMSYILASNPSKGGMTDEEIRWNSATFISAGSESTATILAGATWYLLKNPDCLAKLNEEIRTTFNSAEDINLDNIEKLPYLHAVIDESFRIYPPALAGQPRLSPPQGDTVSGYWVPGGTGIQLNQLAAFRSTLNFTSPETFAPSRWLGDPRFASDRLEVVQPFSVGPRNCIGKKDVYDMYNPYQKSS